MASFEKRDMDWLFTLSGFALGAIVGLTCVGGGSLETPFPRMSAASSLS